MQALNLNIENIDEEIDRILKIVRMEDFKKIKFKSCSLGMKQRMGIAMALLGNPKLLILDEPINGLDVDGMRIMREVLIDLVNNNKVTIVISSHILGELEKIATHYGIIRGGAMIKEMTAEEFENECRTYIALKTDNLEKTKLVLLQKYYKIEEDEAGYSRVYDMVSPEDVVSYLYNNKILINEIFLSKISLEEYYIDLMKEKRGQ